MVLESREKRKVEKPRLPRTAKKMVASDMEKQMEDLGVVFEDKEKVWMKTMSMCVALSHLFPGCWGSLHHWQGSHGQGKSWKKLLSWKVMEKSWNMKISQKVMEESWNCLFSWLWQLSSLWLSCMLWDSHNHVWNHVRMGVMERSKSVMEKSWNSVFRFLWEPCIESCQAFVMWYWWLTKCRVWRQWSPVARR